jgi:hypothetical protein
MSTWSTGRRVGLRLERSANTGIHHQLRMMANQTLQRAPIRMLRSPASRNSPRDVVQSTLKCSSCRPLHAEQKSKLLSLESWCQVGDHGDRSGAWMLEKGFHVLGERLAPRELRSRSQSVTTALGAKRSQGFGKKIEKSQGFLGNPLAFEPRARIRRGPRGLEEKSSRRLAGGHFLHSEVWVGHQNLPRSCR